MPVIQIIVLGTDQRDEDWMVSQGARIQYNTRTDARIEHAEEGSWEHENMNEQRGTQKSEPAWWVFVRAPVKESVRGPRKEEGDAGLD